MNQGGKAVKSGQTAEQIIACILKERGFIFKRQYNICQSIYGHPVRIDFFIENVEGYPDGIAIESKWQDVPGSIDEKLPYLVLNIKERFPCPVVILLDGEGQKKGAIEWVRNQVDGDRLHAVFTIREFLSWVLRDIVPTKEIELTTPYEVTA